MICGRLWEAMGLLPSTRASTVQSSRTGLGRPSSHGSGAIPGALLGPSFWMSACWSIFQILVVLLGQKSDPDVIFVAQNFWDHPGIRTIHAQDFLVGFTPPSMGHMGQIGSPVRQSWPNCWRHLAARMTRSACMLCPFSGIL